MNMLRGKAVCPNVTRLMFVLLISSTTLFAAEDRATAVRNDLTNVVSAGGWIYNDLQKGFTEAAATRKPMLVVFRCVP
jgi:serine protease Do